MKTVKRLVSILVTILLLSSGAFAEGILPALQTPTPITYAISLHSATGVIRGSSKGSIGTGMIYSYSNVSYECYLEFSKKLADEGYKLVSSETLEDGTSRAAVSNGLVTMTIDYQLSKQTATVTYSPYVYARDAFLYEDYIELKEGDQFELADGIKATLIGWHPIDSYFTNQSTNNVKKPSTGYNYCWLSFELDYSIPSQIFGSELLAELREWYDDTETYMFSQSGLSDQTTNTVFSDKDKKTSYLFGQMRQMHEEWALIIYLTDEEMRVPEKTTITFTDRNHAKRYVYRLTPKAEDVQAIPEELVGIWWGVGTPKNGGTSIDLTITIEADGSGEYTFAQGKYTESYPFTVSYEDNTFAVDIPATSQLGKVEGTYALEDEVLVLDITTTFASGGTYSYIAECAKQED